MSQVWSPVPRSQVQGLYQGHRRRAQNQSHFQSWPSPTVTVAKSPPSLTSQLHDPKLGKMPIRVITLEHPNQSPNATLPAGISCLEAIKLATSPRKAWSPLSQPIVLTASGQLSLARLEVSPLCLQLPHYLCSLFLINSLLSEILCVWKFFSNSLSGWHDTRLHNSRLWWN